jgi:hypothetical protein
MKEFSSKSILVEGRDAFVCEDAAYIGENFAFVIDGAGGVDGAHVTDAVTDAKWFAEEWKTHLISALNSNRSILDIIKDGVPKIAKKYDTFDGAKGVKDKPSAAIAIVRIQNEYLEYFVLCDAVMIVRKKNGTCELITDARLNVLDDINFEHMKRIAKEKGIPNKDAFEYIKPYILENRYKMNTPDGYAALAHTVDGLDSAVQGKFPLDEVADFVVFSDGFAESFDLFDIYASVDELIEDVSVNGIEQAVEKLHREHDKDPECNIYVRNKKCDDISVVYAKIL